MVGLHRVGLLVVILRPPQTIERCTQIVFGQRGLGELHGFIAQPAARVGGCRAGLIGGNSQDVTPRRDYGKGSNP